MVELTDGAGLAGRPKSAARSESGAVDEVDQRTVRVDVRTTMAIDVGPWTIGPDDPREIGVRWLDAARAVVEEPSEVGPTDRIPVLVGRRVSPSRSSIERLEVVVGGWRILLALEPERRARLRERARRGREDAAHAGPLEVRAIIPGRVVAVSVAEGDTVEAGQQLLVVEAMKMQNELRSPRAGTVERIAVGVGQTVDLAALLLVLR